MGWVYMLRCRDGSYYVGSTRDLDERLDLHRRGLGSQYTRHRLPVELVWCEGLESIADAFAMEKRVQGWSRAKREALIRGDFAEISRLAHVRGGRRARE
ncbi:GIY-YIG nuclease family protein [Agrococcus sediminis]|uniref:GIY-YIG nuclease family protein n=1 Tax=Agrococcus sediminis TaxID=2599924 RepID=UPI003425AA0F